MRFKLSVLLSVALLFMLLTTYTVDACGGLFCQNTPVDQQAERIIFTVNGDNTITAYVQINYTGEAPDFSWVVPVPSVPEVDVAEIATFDELSTLTAPVFTPPPVPDCAMVLMAVPESAAAGEFDDSAVEVLAAGTAGPYAYEVVTSPDPNALILWLRDHNYRVTEEMEPLIRVYNTEGMVFLAMQLQPDQGVADIQPIVMTYESTKPMIPLRLTAVAANPNMNVVTWIFADAQAYPINYAHPVVHDKDIRFSFAGSPSNYLQLVDDTVDLYDGRAFITEYAQPTENFMLDFALTDPLVREFATRYDYVTRFFGRISPEEMTVDPVFDFSNSMENISNIHDLRDFDPKTVWGCNEEFPAVEYDPSVVPAGFQ